MKSRISLTWFLHISWGLESEAWKGVISDPQSKLFPQLDAYGSCVRRRAEEYAFNQVQEHKGQFTEHQRNLKKERDVAVVTK